MSRVSSGIVIAGVLASTTACVTEVGLSSIPDADFGEFVERVQPVLSKRCANPSCHGTVLRPLEIYGPTLHRADPDRVHEQEPLTEQELRANFDRSRAFLLGVERPEQALFLSKPLAVAAGGTGHADVDVFETRDDPEYLRLHDWVEEALAESEGSG